MSRGTGWDSGNPPVTEHDVRLPLDRHQRARPPHLRPGRRGLLRRRSRRYRAARRTVPRHPPATHHPTRHQRGQIGPIDLPALRRRLPQQWELHDHGEADPVLVVGRDRPPPHQHEAAEGPARIAVRVDYAVDPTGRDMRHLVAAALTHILTNLTRGVTR